jgi:hypothetical protein
MRLIPALVASTLLVGLAPGCNTEPPYNTLAEISPGGDPPVKRPIPVTGNKARNRKPKPPITENRRKVEVDATTPIAK